MKSAVVCTKCLCPGHKRNDCRPTLTCATCGSGTHHSLVCRNNSKSDKSENSKLKQKPKDGNTTAFKTGTEDDTTAGDPSAGAIEDLTETVNHCLNVFSLNEVETYLIDQIKETGCPFPRGSAD